DRPRRSAADTRLRPRHRHPVDDRHHPPGGGRHPGRPRHHGSRRRRTAPLVL
ncbi:MAG: hypothetical protein AVDCRST_MAG79-2945, partial [uncultured Thermoleophilia bacterium]